MTSHDTHDPSSAHEDASLVAETPNDAHAYHPNEDEDKDEGQGGILRSQSAASVHTVPAVPAAVCQQLYVDSGNDKMVLYLLSIGLRNNNSKPLAAFDKEPWRSLPKNQFGSPKNLSKKFADVQIYRGT